MKAKETAIADSMPVVKESTWHARTEGMAIQSRDKGEKVII